jgi:hypothetical protein
MTHSVTDDQLGKLSRKLFEIHRRVKEGSIEFGSSLLGLQRLIEGRSFWRGDQSLVFAIDNVAISRDEAIQSLGVENVVITSQAKGLIYQEKWEPSFSLTGPGEIALCSISAMDLRESMSLRDQRFNDPLLGDVDVYPSISMALKAMLHIVKTGIRLSELGIGYLLIPYLPRLSSEGYVTLSEINGIYVISSTPYDGFPKLTHHWLLIDTSKKS